MSGNNGQRPPLEFSVQPSAPTPDAAGRLSQEGRRNLRRALGEPATDAFEQARQIAHTVSLQQAALARDYIDFKAATENDLQKLHARVDGAAAWCKQNEDELDALKGRLHRLEQPSCFRGRVRWFLGLIPWPNNER